MKEKIEELYIEAVYNDIAPNVFADEVMQILNKMDSKQLVCNECNFVELQGDIYQRTKCHKIQDRLAN